MIFHSTRTWRQPGTPRSTSGLAVIVLLLFCGASRVFAQSQGTISGTITDPQGAAIPEAKVAVTNTATGVTNATTSNGAGAFLLPNLDVGTYRLSVERSGFQRYTRNGVVLSTGQTLGLEIPLQVGDVSQTMTVTEETPQIETRSSEVGQLIESKSVASLPLGNRRTMNIINLTGGAVFVGYDTGQKPNFSLAGGRTQSQMFWIDGASAQNMRLGIGQLDIDPPAEIVREVQVLSNNYGAEYGASAGGVILETTKSGSNEFHGSAYEYLRNDAFDAPGFFAPVVNGSKQIPKLRYNVFGGTIGGPVIKNKTFFFFGYEGQRQRVGNSTTLTVPALAQRQGDFSQTLNNAGNVVPIYDPQSTQIVNGVATRTQFAGNLIPASRLDPVALKVLQYYPVPNRTPDGPTGANNFRANGITGLTGDFYTVRIDHNLSDRDRLTGRYMYNSGNNDNTSVFPDPGADPTTYILAHQQYVYSAWTRSISPTLVNDLRFNYGNRVAHQLTLGVGGDYVSKLGLQGVSDNAFPYFAPAGYSPIGSNNQERRQYPIQNYQWVDNLSWIKGRHAFKFGFEARESKNYEVNLSTASGSFTFSTQPTGLPANGTTGNGIASLLVGFPTAFVQSQTQVMDRYSWYFAGFVQDDYTITPHLTLNLGLRWETDTPITDANNRMNSFDASVVNPISGTPGIVTFAGRNGYPTHPYETDLNNFGPRFGFAWQPFGSSKTVIRGGYGVFFAHPFDTGQPASANLGFSISNALNTPDNGITAPFYLSQGVPANTGSPTLDSSFGAVPLGRNPTTAVTYFDPTRRTGYSQQFNVNVQRQLPSSIVVEVTGIGNLSHKLPNANLSINQIDPAVLGPGRQSQINRPFPQFSNVTILSPTIGDAAYYAGMVRVEKRFSHGLNFVGSYTYSKFLDNSFEGGSSVGADNGPYSNYYNRAADWGPSPNDIRHRFNFSEVYELPFGKEKRWLTSGPLSYLVGGWTLGSVTTLQSGAPFTVVTQTNTTNSFSAGSLRANVAGDPNLPNDQRTVTRWFDTSVFTQPAPYTFGNQGRDILRGPGLINVDVSLLRNFGLGEHRLVQLRGEFLNVLNHTNLSLPSSTFGAPSFGSITASGPARQIQIGARFQF